VRRAELRGLAFTAETSGTAISVADPAQFTASALRSTWAFGLRKPLPSNWAERAVSRASPDLVASDFDLRSVGEYPVARRQRPNRDCLRITLIRPTAG